MNFPTYEEREIRSMDLFHFGAWRFKVYGIRANPPLQNEEFIATEKLNFAKQIATKEVENCAADQRDNRVGYIILHQGNIADWAIVNWWFGGIFLRHRLYRLDDAGRKKATLINDGLSACIWELRVCEFESAAWRSILSRNSPENGVEDYLKETIVGFY